MYTGSRLKLFQTPQERNNSNRVLRPSRQRYGVCQLSIGDFSAGISLERFLLYLHTPEGVSSGPRSRSWAACLRFAACPARWWVGGCASHPSPPSGTSASRFPNHYDEPSRCSFQETKGFPTPLPEHKWHDTTYLPHEYCLSLRRRIGTGDHDRRDQVVQDGKLP